ncbi:hypothetical protein K432DRAFT_351109 [Lepidopterella palustris CBS 459.81]|uniref:CFEM domain-containing protein n=1 Tax=Lepidopterella palustris CBS 459.81 TaxID=1314670 RepID=A0A8E2ED65_9PEZI|nr:hypothetical protein K432DRAFT_351109 [Lepidopterella palustris CBS 459.81]
MKAFRNFAILTFTLMSLVKADLPETALASLPTCAINCMTEVISNSPCQLTDMVCVTKNEALNAKLTACVKASCTIRESLTAKNFSETAIGAPVRDRTHLVTIIELTGGAIALLAVLLRLMERLPCLGGVWGLDDWAIIVTMIPVIPLTCLSIVLAKDGLGKDVWTVPFENINHILRIYYFDESFYLSSLALTKISILLFYLRIFPDRAFRRAVYITMAFCVGYILAFIPLTIFQCRPINLAWTRWDGEHSGTCVNLNAEGWTSAAFNIALDVTTIVLPLRQLSTLKMSRRKKVGIMFMFMLGFFVTIISMLRLKWMIQFANTTNVTWDYVPIGYWSTIEVDIGVICACLPALRALQVRLFPSTRSASHYYNPAASASSYYQSKQTPTASNVSIIRSKSKAERKMDGVFFPLDDLSVENGEGVMGGRAERAENGLEVRVFGAAVGEREKEAGKFSPRQIVVRKEYSVNSVSVVGL